MKASYHLWYWFHNGSLDENQRVNEYALTPVHSGTRVQPSSAETELWIGMMEKEREWKEEGELFGWGFRWGTFQAVLIAQIIEKKDECTLRDVIFYNCD